jgi:hypothetical protein
MSRATRALAAALLVLALAGVSTARVGTPAPTVKTHLKPRWGTDWPSRQPAVEYTLKVRSNDRRGGPASTWSVAARFEPAIAGAIVSAPTVTLLPQRQVLVPIYAAVPHDAPPGHAQLVVTVARPGDPVVVEQGHNATLTIH